MANFFGLIITKDDTNGKVTLTQEGLPDRTICAMHVQDSNPNFTLAGKIPLGKKLEGEAYSEEWNYISVVGT